MKQFLKPITYSLAALYFLADAAFIAIAQPISDWLARHVALRRLRTWIRSLRPYPSLALFSVLLIIFEIGQTGCCGFIWLLRARW